MLVINVQFYPPGSFARQYLQENSPNSKYIEEKFRSLFKYECPNEDYVLTLDNAYKMF